MIRVLMLVMVLLTVLLAAGCTGNGAMSVLQQVYGSGGEEERAEEVDVDRLPLKQNPASITLQQETSFIIKDIKD